MSEEAPRIILVDASDADLRIHAATLRARGYEVVTARDGENARRLVDEGVPDLFLLARIIEGQDGYSLCEELKQDPRLDSIPVVFITDRRDPEEIKRCYDVGGVDYIVKPCHLNEFETRVSVPIRFLHLIQEVERLREAAIDANPLTHLPGNNTIVATIQRAVEEDADTAVLYTDLDNFKAYNDAYGFNSGDDVLLFNAETLQTVLRVVCDGEGFLGHVGGDDFVMMVPANKLEEVGREIAERFDGGVPAFYTDEDLERKGIEAHDRQGEITFFPIVSISMGAVVLSRRIFTRYVEVAEVCAEVKHKAKTIEGSNLFIDRRGNRRPSDPPDRKPYSEPELKIQR
ncbi:MAG: response regulator [bacterium]|nr:response regulator [bacterium]